MSSSYPASLDALSTAKVDATVTGSGDHAGHHNDLADAINKIETELGTVPKGAWTDLRTRLEDALDTSDRHLYEALRQLGSGGLPIAWTFDPVVATSVNDLTMTAQRLAGGAFVVNKAVTAAGVSVQCSTPGTSFRNYSGAALYQMNSSGDWSFLIDTGANNTSLFASGGWNSLAFTATQQLTDGNVYVVAIVSDWTGTAPVIAGLTNSRVVNLGQGAGPMRSAARSTVTTRQNATILNANLNNVTNLPFIAVYGT